MQVNSNVIVGTLLLLFHVLRFLNERPRELIDRATLALVVIMSCTLIATPLLARLNEHAATAIFWLLAIVLIILMFKPNSRSATGRR